MNRSAKGLLTVTTNMDGFIYIGVGAGPAGQVLAGPLLFKVKIKCHFCKKQVMNRSASVIFRLVRQVEKGYQERQDYRPPTHTIYCCAYKVAISFIQKQVVKYWCDF